MPEFHTVHAQDNPNPDKVERGKQRERDEITQTQAAQTRRDGAEVDRQQAVQGQAANTENNRDAVDQSAKLGGGPAGLNQGPSDTVSGDPHKPRQFGDLSTGVDHSRDTGGMGFSPPRGAAPTSDKPEPRIPAEEAAKLSGTDAAKSAGAAARAETERSALDERHATTERTAAERSIASAQGGGEAGSAPDSTRKGGFYEP